mmetsp:Transcript_32871/g.105415  ORF Transcript_32871/g.105415 Transcript_32871/m.105415 type:complete len:207 (+) Transcript_32871:70-690(+)
MHMRVSKLNQASISSTNNAPMPRRARARWSCTAPRRGRRARSSQRPARAQPSPPAAAGECWPQPWPAGLPLHLPRHLPLRRSSSRAPARRRRRFHLPPRRPALCRPRRRPPQSFRRCRRPPQRRSRHRRRRRHPSHRFHRCHRCRRGRRPGCRLRSTASRESEAPRLCVATRAAPNREHGRPARESHRRVVVGQVCSLLSGSSRKK